MEDAIFSELAKAIKNQETIVFLTGPKSSEESGFTELQIKKDWILDQEASKEAKLGQLMADIIKTIHLLPNTMHILLNRLQNFNPNIHIITSSVDYLHRKAGNANLLEIFGNIHSRFCPKCGWETDSDDIEIKCGYCGHEVIPTVNWFGNIISPKTYQVALNTITQAQYFVSVSAFPRYTETTNLLFSALTLNIPTIEVETYPSPLSQHVTHHIDLTSSEFFKKLYEHTLIEIESTPNLSFI